MEILYILLGLAVIGGVSALIGFVCDKIFDLYYKRKSAKEHQEHPDFFYQENIVLEASDLYWEQNKRTASIKAEIDNILAKIHYYPEAKQKELEEKLRELRFDYQVNETALTPLREKMQEERAKLDELGKKYFKNYG
ncbi:MAG: hypothetical protein J6R67_03615 [Treponema sp.]|nr:hypothetical protein [Treponema sp.]